MEEIIRAFQGRSAVALFARAAVYHVLYALRLRRLSLALYLREWRCADCGAEFFLDRRNKPPKGVPATPICNACKPRHGLRQEVAVPCPIHTPEVDAVSAQRRAEALERILRN